MRAKSFANVIVGAFVLVAACAIGGAQQHARAQPRAARGDCAHYRMLQIALPSHSPATVVRGAALFRAATGYNARGSYVRAGRAFIVAARTMLVPSDPSVAAAERMIAYKNAAWAFANGSANAEARRSLTRAAATDAPNADAIRALIADLPAQCNGAGGGGPPSR